MSKPTILLVNDDGFDAVGLKALKKSLQSLAHITVVAPLQNKSASSHSMTLNRPLFLKSFDDDSYTIDGTPTDCVFVALHSLFEDHKPDLVISGINIGSNMGEDITYSGTVAGALEASLHGVCAISISQVFDNLKPNQNKNDFDFELAQKTIYNISKKILNGSYPLGERKILNINVPQLSASKCKGIKITKAGHRDYGDDLRACHNPRGELYYWIGLHPLRWQTSDKSCDFEAVSDGFVSITPITTNMTSYCDIKKLEQWL
jgi:5'-nucleotidase